jgi:polyhydroxybutyrate depolymerase
VGTTNIHLNHEGFERPYLLHTPDTLPDPAPLLVELHGRGIGAERFDDLTGFRALADDEGFALALPSAVGAVWNSLPYRGETGRPDDVSYLLALIDDICGRLPIDRRRVYLAGMSNGAGMAARFACLAPEHLTAFAQVAGTGPAALLAGGRPAQAVPILQIHGSADHYIPYAGGVRRRLGARLAMRRGFGPSIGIEEWARFWIEANQATDGPHVSQLSRDTTTRTWHSPATGADVVFHRVQGGGHTWPSGSFRLPRLLLGRTTQTFDATRVAWDFLSRQTR